MKNKKEFKAVEVKRGEVKGNKFDTKNNHWGYMLLDRKQDCEEIYIGITGLEENRPIRQRLMEHACKKDWWNIAIYFNMEEVCDGFDEDIKNQAIRYVEMQLVENAIEAKRVKVENTQKNMKIPQEVKDKREKLDYAVECIKAEMYSIGCNAFVNKIHETENYKDESLTFIAKKENTPDELTMVVDFENGKPINWCLKEGSYILFRREDKSKMNKGVKKYRAEIFADSNVIRNTTQDKTPVKTQKDYDVKNITALRTLILGHGGSKNGLKFTLINGDIKSII